MRSIGIFILFFLLFATFSIQLALIPVLVAGMLLIGHTKPHSN